jgi:hypothetical protein
MYLNHFLKHPFWFIAPNQPVLFSSKFLSLQLLQWHEITYKLIFFVSSCSLYPDIALHSGDETAACT